MARHKELARSEKNRLSRRQDLARIRERRYAAPVGLLHWTAAYPLESAP